MNRIVFCDRMAAVLGVVALCGAAMAQPPAAQPGRAGRGPQAPAFVSPEVMPDRKVAFRIYAPKAEAVRVNAGDIAGMAQAGGAPPPEGTPRNQMTKGENGVWELVTGPVDPGTYRYTFNVDGVTVLDYRNPSTSESNANPWSLVYVPGADFMDSRETPHGSVAAVTYYSKTLGKFRRLHVYTPPGYETATQKYPIFYLLHGAGDSDDSWTSVGRAGFILDNLIAANKAKPMVVVMPAGHTTRQGFGGGGRGAAAPGGGRGGALFSDDFVKEFQADIMPMVETRYRVIADRAHRAIAGLSMGGAHTLYIATPNLEKFAYIGVYSSGLFGILRGGGRGPGAAPGATPEPPSLNPDFAFETEYKAQLDNPALKKGLKLFWFSTGSQDGLITTTKATVDLYKKHGFNPIFKESPGAHTWINWRNYLNEFAPQLFQ